MRHKVAGKKLNRTSNHRKALFRNVASALVEHGEITTTETKAKVIKRIVDKLITKAKKGSLHSRRGLQSFFNDKTLTTKIVDVIAPQMTQRTSGYTRIVRLGNRRGDDSMMVKLAFVDRVVAPEAVIKPKVSKAKTTKAAEKPAKTSDKKPVVKK